jgi:hypothetical protein
MVLETFGNEAALSLSPMVGMGLTVGGVQLTALEALAHFFKYLTLLQTLTLLSLLHSFI